MQGNAFDPDCPTRVLLDRIGDKWSVLVILSLTDGPRRFTELRRGIGGVTPKVLTQTLRAMERDGLITRRIYAEVPPRVEYDMTPLGRSLHDPIRAITDWAEDHIDEVVTSRKDHDADHDRQDRRVAR